MSHATFVPPSTEQVLCMLHAEYLVADAIHDRKAKLKLLPIMARLSIQLHKAAGKKQKEEAKEKKKIEIACREKVSAPLFRLKNNTEKLQLAFLSKEEKGRKNDSWLQGDINRVKKVRKMLLQSSALL